MKDYIKKNLPGLHFFNKGRVDTLLKDFFEDQGTFFDNLRDTNFFSFFLPVQITEDTKSIYVDIEIPGIHDKKDIEISVHEQVLTVEGEKKSIVKTEALNKHASEIFYGKFKRQISLPSSVDMDSVSAQYQNGVLKISLRKLKETSKKTIKID